MSDRSPKPWDIFSSKQIDEICKSYREAKDRGYQVQIIAELNGCKRPIIEAILLKEGLDVEDAKGKGKRKSKYTDEQIMEAYTKSGDVAKIAAESLGMSYANFNYRLRQIREKGVQECNQVDNLGNSTVDVKIAEELRAEKEKEAEKDRIYKQHEEKQKHKNEKLVYEDTYIRIDSIMSRIVKTDSKETIDFSIELATSILRDEVYRKLGKHKE